MEWIPYAVGGGCLVCALWWRSRANKYKFECEKLRAQAQATAAASEDMKAQFEALSLEALRKNNSTFLDLAKTSFSTLRAEMKGDLESRKQAVAQLVKPVHDALERFDTKVGALEKARAGAYAGIREQIDAMQKTQKSLADETHKLSSALRAPTVRGRWGEIQLRKVVELAGMTERCDFTEQVHRGHEDGAIRPDMIVHLPGHKTIAVDAKTPLEAYLKANEAESAEARERYMREHARHIKNHITHLGRKAYWERLESAPEFVVLFLPGEMFFSAALTQDPGLIELGAEKGVILATPTTLIALLRSIAYGWRQESLSEHAKVISAQGFELYKRLSDLGGHWSRLGKSLSGAVRAFNQATGSLESRVLPAARRFEELGVSKGKEIDTLSTIEETPRSLIAPEIASSEASGLSEEVAAPLEESE
jgi:DNA recombination protein RmuC